MKDLNERQLKLLQYLLERNSSATVKDISSLFSVSERTIRYDLNLLKSSLNEYDVTLQSQPGKGIWITASPENLRRLKNAVNENGRVSSCSRQDRILLRILTCDRCTYENLSDEIETSRQTIITLFPEVEEQLKKVNITVLKEKGSGLHLSGSEFDIRNAMNRFLYRTDTSLNELEGYPFAREDSRVILDEAQKTFGIEYFNMESIRLSIAYSLYRSHNGHCMKEEELPEKIVETRQYQQFGKFRSLLKDESLSDADKDYLTWLLMSSDIRAVYNEEENDRDARQIASYLMEQLQVLHPLDEAEKKKFISGLSTHLNLALYRIRNQIPIKNEMLDRIKMSIPLLYEYTKLQLNQCEKKYSVHFDENEIAYIALYTASTYETSISMDTVVNVLTVCSFGTTTGAILHSRLSAMLPDCNISGPFSKDEAMEYLKDHDVDLIVSTSRLDFESTPEVVVNPLLNPEDAGRIRSELFAITYVRMCEDFMKSYNRISENNSSQKYIRQYMSADEIQIMDHLDSWQQAIQQAALPLLKKGKLEQRYVDRMVEAVITFGTYMVIVPGTAFVHAGVEDGISEDCSAVLVLHHPVLFGNSSQKEVRNIVVMGVKNREQSSLLDLVYIFSNSANQRVLAGKSLNKEIILNLHN